MIGKLKKGDEVEFTGNKTEKINGHEWAEIKYGDKTGWVIADHLKTERPYEADNSKVTETLKEKIRNKKQSCITEEFKEALRKNKVFFTKYDYGAEELFSGLMFAIHGWTESKVDITELIVEKDGTYRGNLVFNFMDNFGLDADDINEFGYLPGFRSWYVLQHYKEYEGKYKPFKTAVTINFPISGKLSENKK